jgi:hypothetical protein
MAEERAKELGLIPENSENSEDSENSENSDKK